MEAIVIFYIAFFGLWILLTIFWQFDYIRKTSALIRKLNTFNILPIWTFFAPNPGMYDTHLLFRDKLENGDITNWKEVDVVQKRKLYHFIWNPLKRKNKLIIDAISEVKTIKNSESQYATDKAVLDNQIKFSKGYLLLLNIAFNSKKLNSNSKSRQFIVLDSCNLNSNRSLIPLFFSPYHKF